MIEECGVKLMQDWVPSGQSLFCNRPKGHEGLHQWHSQWQTFPPAFERTAAEAQFSVIGDELRKLGERIEKVIERQGLMEIAANERYSTTREIRNAQLNITSGINGLGERIQLVMQMIAAKPPARRRKHKGRAR